MSTRMERKRRANKSRCWNCGERERHFDPWTKTFICKAALERDLYPGERSRDGRVG